MTKMKRPSLKLVTPSLTVLVAIIVAAPNASSQNSVDFSRDVLPILSDKCFTCHGPDQATREKDLRLDMKDGLFGMASSGLDVVVPSEPAASELYLRIVHPDADKRMPPSDAELKTTDADIATLKAWIDAGAEWQQHWAFVPPVRAERPVVANEAWCRSEIDYFILKRLEDAGLAPSDEAAKETLIRRVSLDITGLPPSPMDVDAFLADDSDDAYERVVDRLLASPHYGERMAFIWLDVARYADTNGYQRDTKRDMWSWRDWVIQAFNDNMPFDQFTIEQLAGDLLPNATLSQKIATGFNRNHRINGEGGIIPEEYAVEYVADRVSTTSTAWMGLAMGCARCHDHKYDPITQKEFYELYAFFNNVPENGKGGERGNDKPFIQVPTPEQSKRRTELHAKIAELEGALSGPDERLDALQENWEREMNALFSVLDWKVIEPETVFAQNGTSLELEEDGSIVASGESPDHEVHEIAFVADRDLGALRLDYLLDERFPESGPGRSSNGNVILTHVELERAAASNADEREPIRVADAFADFARLDTEYAIGNAIDEDKNSGWSTGSHLKRQNRTTVFALDGATPVKAGDRVTLRLTYASKHKTQTPGKFRLLQSPSRDIPSWTRPALADWHYVGPLTADVQPAQLLETPLGPEEGFDSDRVYANGLRWQSQPDWSDGEVRDFGSKDEAVHYLHRTFSIGAPKRLTLSLGSNDAIKVWVDGELRLSNNIGRQAKPDQETVSLFLNAGDHDLLIKIANYGNVCGYYFRVVDDGGESLLTLMEQLELPSDQRTPESRQALREIFRRQDPEWLAENDKLAALRTDLDGVERGIVTTMIMEDMETPRDTYLLRRGAYNAPDTSEKLYPGVPSIIGEMDEDLPKNRLGFAQWLVDPKHPLTARVRANHYWQMHFGRGLVKTSEDFGVQGVPPTHPELLDWLALEFIDTGWDVKAMQKAIVMSATYRQSSVVTAAHLEIDPGNELLGRAPRTRLTAEMARDQALGASGLLNPKIGGPSVRPYQPEALWSSLTFQNMDEFDTNFYVQDEGDKIYRRGLYTYWKRTIAPPRMQIFGASRREMCSMRQETTNTPMQALALMNDTTYVEAARALGERMIREGGERAVDRVRYGFKLVLAYDPDLTRQQILLSGLSDYQAHFNQRAEDATALLAVGDSNADPSIPETELAAYTMLASVILNLDEAITRE